MREDFFEILEKCRECSIVTMLSTNGWFVDKEITRKLVEADIQIARVSIDGGTEGIHDTIRGVSGSFKRALKAVSLLKEGGVPNVGVSPTLLPDNYFQVDKIIELAIEYGADEVQVVQLCSTGRGEGVRALTPEEFKKARGLVQEAMIRYSDSHITATEGILRKQCERCVSERTAMPSFIGCAGGRSCMAINEEGLIFPCILYRKQAGNLREENLTDIWHHSPFFLSIREIKEDCLECAYSDVCARECPLAENTMTDEERKKFSDMIGEVSINKGGCDKFVSGNLCFIRF